MLHDRLTEAHAASRAHLLSRRLTAGGWCGELSSSALSTATAVIALLRVDRDAHAALAQRGLQWLEDTQCAGGGWGDTSISKPNLSTTLLCRAAFGMAARQWCCGPAPWRKSAAS